MEILEKWLEFQKKNGIGERRLRKYRSLANSLQKLAKVPLDDILSDMATLEAGIIGSHLLFLLGISGVFA